MTTTYNTGNPLGSTAPKDLYDNASNLDDAVNGPSPAWVDRFGKRRQSWLGLENQVADYLIAMGYEPIHLTYVDGTSLTVLRPTQLIDRAGLTYRVKQPSTFPVTLTGTWATDASKLVEVLDSTLRADLIAPTGTNLVGYGARTLTQRLGDRKSFKDFGAVGDGMVDDTAALQAALDSALCISGGSAADIYKISAKLLLRSDHDLQLNGATIFQTVNQTPMFDAIGKSRVTIQGGRFIGVAEVPYVNSPSSQAMCITASTAVDLTVVHNRFEGFCYSALMVNSAGVRIDFSFNTVVGPGSPILGLDINNRNTTGATIIGDNVRIHGNDISATATGLIIGQGSSRISVTGNLIHDLYNEHGIYADTGMRSLAIVGNIIRNTGAHGTGVKVQHYDSFGIQPENIVIAGNSISFTGSDAILVINTVGTALFATGVSITGNSIYGAGQHGIDVRYARNAVISGNSIDQTVATPIYISKCTVLDVVGNSLRISGSHGIFDDGTSGDVSYISNLINSVGTNPANDCGIYIQNVSEHVISGNVVRGTPSQMLYALWIASATGTLNTTEVRGNSFTGANSSAARFPAASGSLRYFGENVFKSNSGNDSGLNVPEVLQRGTEENTYFGTGIPTSGQWGQGTKIYNRYPLAGGFLGWVCVVSGSPGAWKTFGPVSA